MYKKVEPINLLLTIDLKLNHNYSNYNEAFLKGLEFIKKKMIDYSSSNAYSLLCCIKVVVKNKKDIDFAYAFSNEHPVFQIIVSPCYGLISPTEIAEYIVEKKYRNLRMQIQLHKYLWEANAREK